MDALAALPTVIVVLFLACFVTFCVLRDRRSAPPHEVSRLVRCELRDRYTVVRFREQMRSGMTMRRVVHCPLRAPGARCDEACGRLPTVGESTDAAA